LSRDWIARYADASLDRNPVHLDPHFARMHGLPDTIVHGTLLMGLFPHAVQRWQPEARVTGLSATFVLPIVTGTAVRVRGRVVSADETPDGHAVLLRIVLHRADERPAVVGRVTALIPPAAAR
jgi:acyl dehydratase